MGEGMTKPAGGWAGGLVDKLTALWPSLPFMAYGLWSAWISLTYSGSLWLSDNEVDGTHIAQLYIFSTFTCAAVFIFSAVLARRGVAQAIVRRRTTCTGGIIACIGCAVVIGVGPYYLGPWLEGFSDDLSLVTFLIGAVASGAGTALIGLRCAVLFGALAPRRTLINAALAQLASAFVYLLVFACPSWAPVEHGPSFANILFFCVLPLLAAVLACMPVPRSTCAEGVPPAVLVTISDAAGDAGSVGAPSGFAADTASTTRMSRAFWRAAVFTFVVAMFTSIPRAGVVSTHALAATLEGSDLLMVMRVIMALVIIVYAVGSTRTIGFGRICSLLAVFSAMITACAAAFGSMGNEVSLVVYFATSIFELLTWCLLAFVVVQKRVSAVVVFGYGRGLFMLGCGVGWLIGSEVLPLMSPGATTMLYMGLAGATLLAAVGLFSEKDCDRLFSPVSEEELSLEDLFDIELRERAYAAEPKGEKRGRFSRAVEQIVQDYGLSAREGDVLRCLAMGYGSDRIAEHLQVKVNTVRTHTHNVYVKLDVHSREELMKLVDGAVAHQ